MVEHPYATLDIPPGALSEPVNITLRTMDQLLFMPELYGHEIILSPVVSCEPHGLVFRKPVTLTIAHCAYITGGFFNYSVSLLPEICRK